MVFTASGCKVQIVHFFFYHAYRLQSGRWIGKVGAFGASGAQGLGCVLVGGATRQQSCRVPHGRQWCWPGSAFLGLHSALCKLRALGFSSTTAVMSVKPRLIGESCWLCALSRVALRFRIQTCTELYCVSSLWHMGSLFYVKAELFPFCSCEGCTSHQ